MRVVLNGNIYQTKAGEGVTRAPLIEFPQNIRLEGQQRRSDRSLLSSYVIDSWSGGLGIERQNVDFEEHDSRIWDAENVDTRQSAIILSPVFNTCTIVPSRGDLTLAFDFVGNIYFAQTAATTYGGVAFQFSPPFTMGSYRNICTLAAIGSLAAIKGFGGKIVVVGNKTIGTYDPRIDSIATLGGEDTQIGSLGIPRYKGTALPQMSDLGGTLHLLSYHSDEQKAYFYIGNAGHSQENMVTVATISAVIGSYLAPLETDGLTMFAQLPDGLYDFDLTPAKIVATNRAKDMNCALGMFQNYPYFKNKYSLSRYDGTDISSIGYDLDDGLPSDKWGEITSMVSSWKYLFAAVKGATYSHILAMDTGHNWQYYARIPTAGLWVREMHLSSDPDAIDRLWCVFGNHPFPGYFLNPLVNPLQAATYSFVPTGYIAYPIHDGGMIEELGAYYDQDISADGVGASNKITCYYGLNGNSPVTTLGVVATTTQSFIYGSPYGVEGYRIQPKFMLTGSPAGTTPIFRSSIIHYLKQPQIRESYDFITDLVETAKQEVRPLEAVIGSLSYEGGVRTLMPFHYGRIATKNVKVFDMPALEDITEDEIISGERSGFITIKVGEMI